MCKQKPVWSRDDFDGLHVKAPKSSKSKLARALRNVEKVLAELDKEDGDEHGGWTIGAAFDKKGRGSAINVSIYGLDLVGQQALGVVQVRQYVKSSYQARHDLPGSTRKNYFLVGRNERTKEAFAHPLPSQLVRSAVSRDPSPQSSVTAARSWIFEAHPSKLAGILRHGDVAAIPVAKLPPGQRETLWSSPASTHVVDAHVLTAEEALRINERLYARDPVLHHLKNQHADISGKGWHRIQVGLRAPYWKFSRPTAD